MAKVFGGIKGINPPEFILDFKEHQKREEDYIEAVRKNLKAQKPDAECVGEIIQFQVADGYALYMVASMKPLELVHLAVGDAWQFQYAHRLTAKDVREQVERQKRLKEIFS